MNIATVQANFACDNAYRLDNLSSLISKFSIVPANAFFLFLHGLLWGINQTSYGRKALLLAFDSFSELVKEEDKTKLKEITKSLSGVTKFFEKTTKILS